MFYMYKNNVIYIKLQSFNDYNSNPYITKTYEEIFMIISN